MSDLISLRLEKLDDTIEALASQIEAALTAITAATAADDKEFAKEIWRSLVSEKQTLIQQRGDLQVQLTSGGVPSGLTEAIAAAVNAGLTAALGPGFKNALGQTLNNAVLAKLVPVLHNKVKALQAENCRTVRQKVRDSDAAVATI